MVFVILKVCVCRGTCGNVNFGILAFLCVAFSVYDPMEEAGTKPTPFWPMNCRQFRFVVRKIYTRKIIQYDCTVENSLES